MERESKFEAFTLLGKLYASETSKKDRKEAEQGLAALGGNVIQHVADLIEIATSAQLPAENPLKLHAVTYL
jgi:hypothetical protein